MAENTLPLALTMGEPAGIGAEIILKAWQARTTKDLAPFFALGSAAHLQRTADILNFPIEIVQIAEPHEACDHFASALPVLDMPLKQPSTPGELNPANAEYVIDIIKSAVAMARAGHIAGITTAPIQKSVLYETGFRYEGHTDFIAALCGDGETAPHSLQMLTDGELRTIPVTVHIPLSDVKQALTEELIVKTIEISDRAMRLDYGIKEPKIAVTGVNPHAGEDGKMGRDEVEVIGPAMEKARKDGMSLHGPFAADSLFSARQRVMYDLIICMYHDQALIPLKTLSFDQGVNVTLGLPIVRTSPDHGTGLDIAGKGIASPDSMIAAIREASFIISRRVAETA